MMRSRTSVELGPEVQQAWTLDQVLEATWVVGGGDAGADGVGLQGEGGRR